MESVESNAHVATPNFKISVIVVSVLTLISLVVWVGLSITFKDPNSNVATIISSTGPHTRLDLAPSRGWLL